MGRIEIESWPLDAGGVTIKYNGKVVTDGQNVVSAFMVLAGLLAGNPCQVAMNMEERGDWNSLGRMNFERGREAVAASDEAAHEQKAANRKPKVAKRTKK